MEINFKLLPKSQLYTRNLWFSPARFARETQRSGFCKGQSAGWEFGWAPKSKENNKKTKMAASLRHSSFSTWRNSRFLVFSRGVIQSARRQQNSYKCYSASRREFGLFAGLKWTRDSRLLPLQNNFLPPRGKLKIIGLSLPRLSDQYMKKYVKLSFRLTSSLL